MVYRSSAGSKWELEEGPWLAGFREEWKLKVCLWRILEGQSAKGGKRVKFESVNKRELEGWTVKKFEGYTWQGEQQGEQQGEKQSHPLEGWAAGWKAKSSFGRVSSRVSSRVKSKVNLWKGEQQGEQQGEKQSQHLEGWAAGWAAGWKVKSHPLEGWKVELEGWKVKKVPNLSWKQ